LTILKKLVFADLRCEVVHERDIQCVEVEKVIEIGECDKKDVVAHQKMMILELNNYFLILLGILDVVVMKLDTIFSCFTKPVDS
jgi:hypothetical protein